MNRKIVYLNSTDMKDISKLKEIQQLALKFNEDFSIINNFNILKSKKLKLKSTNSSFVVYNDSKPWIEIEKMNKIKNKKLF